MNFLNSFIDVNPFVITFNLVKKYFKRYAQQKMLDSVAFNKVFGKTENFQYNGDVIFNQYCLMI